MGAGNKSSKRERSMQAINVLVEQTLESGRAGRGEEGEGGSET